MEDFISNRYSMQILSKIISKSEFIVRERCLNQNHASSLFTIKVPQASSGLKNRETKIEKGHPKSALIAVSIMIYFLMQADLFR